jgi:predicted alpha-1,6-mannanase (GH76 family)
VPAFGQQWKRFRVAWIALLLLTIASNRLGAGAPPQADDATRAALAANALQAWYSGRTGLYNSTGWWNSANAITALADESRVTGSREYWPVFSNTFIAAQKTSAGFLNKFYDDEGWWAMAWIDVYDLTHEARYLAIAQSIFADMAGGWDATCGGGIWWSKDRKYKNAIANELFLDVAAALANRTEGADQRGYAAWARKEWRWFAQSGMINASHTINDGLNSDEPNGACVNNGKTVWTYNQGVILGGLTELSQTEHNPALLMNAQEIAAAAMATLTDAQGILHDPCEPKCGADGTQFKGILARNLHILNQAQAVPGYEVFMFANAQSVWAQTRRDGDRLGAQWAAPYGAANASSQSSALDLLVAAAALAGKPADSAHPE